jgi:hypothetical protein
MSSQPSPSTLNAHSSRIGEMVITQDEHGRALVAQLENDGVLFRQSGRLLPAAEHPSGQGV